MRQHRRKYLQFRSLEAKNIGGASAPYIATSLPPPVWIIDLRGRGRGDGVYSKRSFGNSRLKQNLTATDNINSSITPFLLFLEETLRSKATKWGIKTYSVLTARQHCIFQTLVKHYMMVSEFNLHCSNVMKVPYTESVTGSHIPPHPVVCWCMYFILGPNFWWHMDGSQVTYSYRDLMTIWQPHGTSTMIVICYPYVNVSCFPETSQIFLPP